MQDLLNETQRTLPLTLPSVNGTKLLVGKDFWEVLSDNAFQQGWDSIYESCPWATAFQSRAYVVAWYAVFSQKFVPVIVVAEANGKISDLLTMAVPASTDSLEQLYTQKVQIIAAGEYEAEYQVWLADPVEGEVFIKNALSLLKEQFPKADILFRFIPANAPVSWINEDESWKNRCVLQAFRRPLLELQDPNIPQLLRLTRQHKTKYNRLKRKGELKFERILEKEQFAVILQELAVQYDFRQASMFNMNQFLDNPLKKDFLMRLFEHDLLHVTVLQVNQEVIAAMVATQGKNWVHLQGLNTHSPFHAKNSPGILHFFLLGTQLAEERYGVFDLTPGGDGYKERFATKYDQVYSLAVTDSKVYRLKRNLRKHIHTYLIHAGHRPMSVELGLKRKVYLLRARLKGMLKGQWPLQAKPATLRSVAPLPAPALPLQTNSLRDLLCHEPGGGRTTRWEFLEDAMARFEEGQSAYTLAENGCLLCCAWMSILPQEDETETHPNDGLLELTYCQPDFATRLPHFLGTCYHIAGISTSTNAPVRVYDNHFASILKKSGYQEIALSSKLQ